MEAIESASASNAIERSSAGSGLPLLIVDASNVAFGGPGESRKASLSLLLEVVSQIPKAGCELKAVADASLRHRIDEKQAYEGFVRSGFFLQAPAGRPADQFIALLARKRLSEGQRVHILTNDLLRQLPDLEQLRVTFLVVSKAEVLFDPPLASLSATGGSGAKPFEGVGTSTSSTDPTEAMVP